tara:strand:- start:7889 stop:8182 length:294 start_codon:yes stop_codon:yes gene_type:complete
MVMKKVMTSDDGMAIVSSSEDTKDKFPVGFQYVMGATIYTVKNIVDKDPNTDMRRVVTSEGEVEILTVASMEKDMKEFDCKVLDNGIKKEDTNKDEA